MYGITDPEARREFIGAAARRLTSADTGQEIT